MLAAVVAEEQTAVGEPQKKVGIVSGHDEVILVWIEGYDKHD